MLGFALPKFMYLIDMVIHHDYNDIHAFTSSILQLSRIKRTQRVVVNYSRQTQK